MLQKSESVLTALRSFAACLRDAVSCYNEKMHWLFKLILVTAGNAFALWLANWASMRYFPGFILSAPIVGLIIIALILTILNFLLKPVLTLILGPLIIITLGLGLIVVNAIVIWVLAYLSNLPQFDFMHGSISIQSIPALFFATIIISIVNFVIHLIT